MYKAGEIVNYRNPILSGFHPDPSICRVGEDFYLVTSTFTYYPGVPIFHSQNLVDWSLVGHCLTRESQIDLTKMNNSKGIYAPVIRYHDGIFYVITTEVTGRGNFIVHSRTAEGPWSDPILIKQNGIDPSLFWDDDGTCWYCGKGILNGKRGIVGFALNPLTGEILTEKTLMSSGCGGQHTEGPHVLKKDGWYYLVMAEGGTQYGHRVVVQRSKTLANGYEDCPHNPLLYHGEQYLRSIQAVGHADIFEDHHGNWWAVCLGIRKFASVYLHNLGRETFLVPVVWKDGWPYLGKNSCVDMMMKGPLPKEPRTMQDQEYWEFDYHKGTVPKDVSYIRYFEADKYYFQKNRWIMKGTTVTLDDLLGSPVCMMREQREFRTEATACISLVESKCGRFGLTVYYSNYNHYDIAVCKEDEYCFLTLYKHIYDFGAITEKLVLPENVELLWIKIKANEQNYSFYYSFDQQDWNLLGQGSIAALCTEVMMERSFTGTMIGLFAEGGCGVFFDKFVILSQRNGENEIEDTQSACVEEKVNDKERNKF